MDPSPTPAALPVAAAPLAQRVYAWLGIVGVPAIWTMHLLASELLVGTACAGGAVQHNPLPWRGVETALRAGSAVAFVAALVCTLLAWRAWRAAACAAHAHCRAQPHAEAADHGKHRFLALCGALVSAGFTVALGFTASVLIAASPSQLCEPFR